jgi:N-acetylated-alpha-linked acidic dipeptidase
MRRDATVRAVIASRIAAVARRAGRQTVFAVLVGACILAAPLGTWLGRSLAQEAPADIRGFAASRAAEEADLERKFEAIPDAARSREDLRHLTSEPHMAGTDASRRVAEWLRDQFRSYGFDADIVTYSAYLPLAKEASLELVAPVKESLAAPERALENQNRSDDDRIPPAASGYSASGEVVAPVVYANYGSLDDYRMLERLQVDVRGKLVLVRYGRDYRGVKVKLAEDRGAAGVIIYSDPNDDGDRVGELFPTGPWRPLDGVQRGSVLYTQLYPGDPLTPDLAGLPEGRQFAPANAPSLPRIPSLALSAWDAGKIFEHLGGRRAPHLWQGGLPVTYRVGPGSARLHMKVVMDAQQRPIYNVIAKMRGVSDDEWVVLGNHHDAWVYGAADPGSGTSAMLEAARALGELARSGWKPRRTIVICEWDAEEPGLVGSTKWVQANRAELQAKALAYINTDVGVTGSNFSASAVPSLKEFIRGATRNISDPASGKTLQEAWLNRSGQSAQAATQGRDGSQWRMPVAALGAGSDFSPFLDYAGIPAIDVSFTGDYGVYHSRYDDFYWMQHFGDPTFAYHAALARVIGVLALRMAQADVVPFDYPAYAGEIARAEDEISSRAAAITGAHAILGRVSDASLEFSNAATRVQEAVAGVSLDAAGPAKAAAIEHEFSTVEQSLLAPQGLSARTWYRHTVFAPGIYAGYAAEALPGISEAIEREDLAALQREADSLAAALHRASLRLNAVAQLARTSAAAGVEGH